MFGCCKDRNEEKYSPLTDLALELNEYSAAIAILPGEQRTVKVIRKHGTLRLKSVKFVYADEE